MEKRLNNLHYVVFCLVLLVFVMGVIFVVRAPATDFVGHNLNGIQGLDVNNNGIVDRSDRTTVADRVAVVDRVTVADRATNADKTEKFDLALANLIVEGINNAGKVCSSNADCGSLSCIDAVAAVPAGQKMCVITDQNGATVNRRIPCTGVGQCSDAYPCRGCHYSCVASPAVAAVPGKCKLLAETLV